MRPGEPGAAHLAGAAPLGHDHQVRMRGSQRRRAITAAAVDYHQFYFTLAHGRQPQQQGPDAGRFI